MIRMQNIDEVSTSSAMFAHLQISTVGIGWGKHSVVFKLLVLYIFFFS